MSLKKIELIDIKKTYFLHSSKTKELTSINALDSVSMTLFPKKIYSVVGENGAGKSTLVNILGATIKASSGKILIDDVEEHFNRPKDARKTGFYIIMQSLPLFFKATVLESLFIEDNFYLPFMYKKREKLKKDILTLFEYWSGSHLDFNQKISSLSKEDQFFLELATTFHKKPRLLILDESSSLLNSTCRSSFFEKLKVYAKDKNMVVLNITHDIDEAIEISDFIAIIKKGKIKENLNLNSLKNSHEILSIKKKIKEKIETIIKSSYENPHTLNVDNIKHQEESDNVESGEPVFSIELFSSQNRFAPFNVSLKKGEILIAKFIKNPFIKLFENLLSGMLECIPSDIRGGIRIEGDDSIDISYKDISPSTLLFHKIGFVPYDRYYRASHPNISIQDALLCYHTKNIIRKEDDMEAFNILKTEGIKVCPKDFCNMLSGGQLQRIILSRTLKQNPNIIILVEPMRGLDIRSMERLKDILVSLSYDKKSILILTREEHNSIYDKISTKIMLL